MYIHQHQQWPHFVWNKEAVAIKLAEVNKAAGYLEGRLSAIGFDAQMKAVVETVSHSVICSSEIEGVQLNSDQVRSSVARKLGVPISGEVASSHYVDGVVEMMLDAMVHYDQPLTADRLFGWHCCLFPTGRSGYATIDVGEYRKGEMKVVSGMFGREKVHYVAPAAENVEKEMNAFLAWFNGSTEVCDYVKSAVAHLWFVCIHPFDDGNGRIGRAIADMALNMADRSKMRFFSMSRQINAEKKKYYEVLEQTQNGDCDITEWLVWYLSCMIRAISASDDALSRVLSKATFWQVHAEKGITERQRGVLNKYLDGYQGKLTVKKWAKFAAVSADTASRDVKDLVAKGILAPQEGRVRDVSYGIVISADDIYVPGTTDDDE